MVSVVFTIAASDYILNNPADSSATEVALFYGGVAESAYTCFKALLGGQSWGETLDPLVHVGPMCVVLFLLFISFSILALLNVVTGVFVDQAIGNHRLTA